jgi:hypothetical protein
MFNYSVVFVKPNRRLKVGILLNYHGSSHPKFEVPMLQELGCGQWVNSRLFLNPGNDDRNENWPSR